MSNYIRNTTVGIANEAPLALAVGSEAFILNQEARGQRELAESTVLPSNMREGREAYQALGFKIGGPVDGDPLFVNAELPHGWSKRPTDHSMWTDIVDDKGRSRGSIFYKAAFYDRDAFMRLTKRYNVECDYDKSYNVTSTFIIDAATGSELARWDGDARATARDWLGEHRPDHDNIVRSWEGA